MLLSIINLYIFFKPNHKHFVNIGFHQIYI